MRFLYRIFNIQLLIAYAFMGQDTTRKGEVRNSFCKNTWRIIIVICEL